MSESEKKKRGLYRKNREKWIFVQSVIIAVVTVAIVISSIVSYQFDKKYYIGYTESGNIDYDVYLKPNQFFDSKPLGKDQSYVAAWIDKIITNFSYQIDMDTDDVNYRYSYSIKSRLEMIDNENGLKIYNGPIPQYKADDGIIVSVNEKTQSSSNRLTINEIAVINYDEYNAFATEFIEVGELKGDVTSYIVVSLNVDVLSDCDAFTGSSADTYSSELRIPLTTKLVNVEITSSVPEGESKMIACTRGMGSEAFKTTAVVLGVVDVLLILLLVAFILLTRTPDITYTASIKKILSRYKSYIQKINNLFETHGYQIIMVDSFDEMLEIRDTIQAPILMYENESKTCTKFMIPTDSKLLYVYEVKVEGYVEPKVEPKQEPVPTTIVKPNITNVVRPVVKVVVTPPSPPPAPEPENDPEPEIETVVEDVEIEVEAEENYVPEVTATVEEAEEAEEAPVIEAEETVQTVETAVEEEPEAEIEEILASIPSADEDIADDNTVEAINIFWEERTHKLYRYDPDGNSVDKGDIVLVPTRDELSDKDVVREAEVARGNYKIDAATLDRPLKKIIGVVRRKAEQVFTAMILPNEEKDNEND